MAQATGRISVTKASTFIEHKTLEDLHKGEMVASLFKHLSVQELATVFANASKENQNLINNVVYCEG